MFPDLNCDMGEGLENDEAIMPYISSVNIACGFHAGSGDTIRRTMDLAVRHGVKIGAHPSFRDKEHFGRRELHLSQDKIYALVIEQLIKMDLIAREKNLTIHHVKPHGALYNMAARDQMLARTIVTAIKDFDESLVVYGLSGSALITESLSIGLSVAREVFADRLYDDQGMLVPRSQPGAELQHESQVMKQVAQILQDGTVTSASGRRIPVEADTICIHGDHKQSASFAKAIYSQLHITEAL